MKRVLTERNREQNGSMVTYTSETKKRGRPRRDHSGEQLHQLAQKGRDMAPAMEPYDPEMDQTVRPNTKVLAKLSPEDMNTLGLGVAPDVYRHRLKGYASASKKAKSSLTKKR